MDPVSQLPVDQVIGPTRGTCAKISAISTRGNTMSATTRTPVAPWRIGVDVGGTFTDLVLADSTGATWVAKVPSVPADPSRGVLAGLDRIAVDLGTPTEDVLAGCSLFVHGSTVATNTMLEDKGATVGLITTEGFRDSLEIRRGMRADQWNHRAPYAPVLVPRYLRRSVPGRIDADGSEHQPLDLDGLDELLAGFAAEGVEAVAIALMNSYVDERHEQEVAAAVRERWDGDWITTSANVSPLMGEYERTSTAVINATLSPRIVQYLSTLEGHLGELGLRHSLLLVQSNGGAASVAQVAGRPVNLLLSGPAAAVGALSLYSRAVDEAGVAAGDEGNVISMEIGGTSCDVLLMSGGEVDTKDEIDIAGYHVSTPAIDIHTIGAGGGTIARVDNAGLLHVGPQGAGADPGPACYRSGGTLPTVTDAQLVLGRLRPGKSAGGTLDLDLDAAVAALDEHVAGPLDMTVHEAAAGIVELVEQHLLSAVEHISIERGHSPRRFTLVAAGGAGPMHGAPVASGLGCSRVYVPRDAGALCAIGMLHADVRQDFTRVLIGPLEELPLEQLEAGFAELRSSALEVMGEEGFAPEDVTLIHELELHHPGQLWTIRVRVPTVGIDVTHLRVAFEAEYRRLYGHVQQDGTIAVTSLRLTARASTGQMMVSGGESATQPLDPIEVRSVWHGDAGWVDTPIYDGSDVRPGHRIMGPALVEELTTTVLARPGDELWVDDNGDFFIDLATSDPAPTPDPRTSSQTVPSAALSDSSSRDPTGGLDPVLLALMQNRLDQISRHMGWVMTRTARSTIFSQSHDFSCFITTPDGTLVANADGIPIHTGGGGFAVRALLGRYGDRLDPGDVFLLSDPYVAGGNHLPDWVIARPIFFGDDDPILAGFCCNRAHQSDIGGGLAGTYNPEATEIWQEGIRLPVMKLIEQGRVRDDVWELLLINSRTPELLDGDLLAMLGSTQIGGERVAALVEELGVQPYLSYLDGVLDHADRRMRSAVADLPDGTYFGEDHSDNDCFRQTDIAIRVAITVDGDELTLDFSESDPQIKGFKNSSLANTYSSAYLAISGFFDTSIPRNEGTYRGVTIVAPQGTIVNALPPAPMTMNTVYVAHEIVISIWQALAQAAPERACAAWSKTMHGHLAGHRDDGTTWVMYQWHAMGTPGATAERDGFAQMGHLVSLGGLDIPNLEFHEQQYPVRYVRHEQRIDNAGAGTNRGGTGVRYEADILAPAIWSFRAEGLTTPSGHGVQGGGTGGVGYEWIVPVDEDADGPTFVPPKYGVKRLGPARMIADTPGGGGWGDPMVRDPARVLRDVRDEVLSVEAATSQYGVVISDDGRSVNEQATRNLRSP